MEETIRNRRLERVPKLSPELEEEIRNRQTSYSGQKDYVPEATEETADYENKNYLSKELREEIAPKKNYLSDELRDEMSQ